MKEGRTEEIQFFSFEGLGFGKFFFLTSCCLKSLMSFFYSTAGPGNNILPLTTIRMDTRLERYLDTVRLASDPLVLLIE